MTSSVTIKACLADDKQVEITSKNQGKEDITILQDGESTELYFYDDIEVSAKEVLKSESLNKDGVQSFAGGKGKTKPPTVPPTEPTED